jgi:hypothetical protein
MIGQARAKFMAALMVTGAVAGGIGLVPAQAANPVSTSYASGYAKAPNYYDVSSGPAQGSFSFTVTNNTSGTISTTVEFIGDRIISVQGVNVSAGYPAYSESYLGAHFSQTIQQFYALYQKQPLTLGPNVSQTVTFQFQLTKCGYYQFDSDAVGNSVPGLFATGFTRVIGCGPFISTTPAPTTGAVGTVISDTATLSGGASPTGTVTFSLYGPGDSTCSGTNLVAGLTGFAGVPLSGASAVSAGYATTQPGTYNWVASYSGDVSNPAVTSACGAEQVVIQQAQPLISTTPSTLQATVGASISDGAVVSGGYTPTGTVTFALYGPADTACSGPDLVAGLSGFSGVPLSVGMASSASYPTTATGTYSWVATYNGDANNLPAVSGCGSEQVVIQPAQPSISTTASAAEVTIGAPISDSATVTGGFNPTGTVSFALYGPGDGTCSGPNLVAGMAGFADVPLSGGSAGSPAFATSAVGTYNWVATYNGDANNNPVSSGCGAEQVVVDMAKPELATTPSPTQTSLGGSVSDTAMVSGGYSPGGTVSFALYGPNDSTCSGTNLVAGIAGFSGVPLSGGLATSPAYTPTQVGTYNWVATYSGDADNQGATSGCGAEQVVVTKPLGNQGCTPGFWKNPRHYSLWTGYSPTQLVGSVFTVPSTFPDGSSGDDLASSTLAEALAFKGGSTLNGAAQILLRAATSGLLNASSPGVAYSMTAAQIITSVDSALNSGDRSQIINLATAIDDANNGQGGCPLS